MVMVHELIDSDPELAYRHAKAAVAHAGRIDVVRELAGFAAYATGRWAEALRELRTARRISGDADAYLAVLADCERGLGRPDRAVSLLTSAAAGKLRGDAAIEALTVLAGARCDLGEFAAAAAVLTQEPAGASDAGLVQLAQAREYVAARGGGASELDAGELVDDEAGASEDESDDDVVFGEEPW